MHLKRNEVPVEWPIERKGTKYVVSTNLRKGVPVLIALRNMLELAGTRKDVKEMIKLGKIKVNHKKINEESHPLALFDILSLENKNFKLEIKNGKFKLEETKDNDEKIAKIIGKKVLNNGKVQLNLSDGRNYIASEKANTGDSAIIDLKNSKIIKMVKMGEKSKIIFIAGKHLGEEGEIEKIENKTAVVRTKKGKVNAELNNLMVTK
jgi:ribosomal protein S4E